jgi:hypothetical protein
MSNSFLLAQVTSHLQTPLSWCTRIFIQGYPLPWLKSPVYPPRSPGKGPLPCATHRASGTWSSRKAGPPLPAVGRSLKRVPASFLSMYSLCFQQKAAHLLSGNAAWRLSTEHCSASGPVSLKICFNVIPPSIAWFVQWPLLKEYFIFIMCISFLLLH